MHVLESSEKRRNEENEENIKHKFIIWAGRIVHVLAQSHKVLQILLLQSLELGIGHLTIFGN